MPDPKVLGPDFSARLSKKRLNTGQGLLKIKWKYDARSESEEGRMLTLTLCKV